MASPQNNSGALTTSRMSKMVTLANHELVLKQEVGIFMSSDTDVVTVFTFAFGNLHFPSSLLPHRRNDGCGGITSRQGTVLLLDIRCSNDPLERVVCRVEHPHINAVPNLKKGSAVVQSVQPNHIILYCSHIGYIYAPTVVSKWVRTSDGVPMDLRNVRLVYHAIPIKAGESSQGFCQWGALSLRRLIGVRGPRPLNQRGRTGIPAHRGFTSLRDDRRGFRHFRSRDEIATRGNSSERSLRTTFAELPPNWTGLVRITKVNSSCIYTQPVDFSSASNSFMALPVIMVYQSKFRDTCSPLLPGQSRSPPPVFTSSMIGVTFKVAKVSRIYTRGAGMSMADYVANEVIVPEDWNDLIGGQQTGQLDAEGGVPARTSVISSVDVGTQTDLITTEYMERMSKQIRKLWKIYQHSISTPEVHEKTVRNCPTLTALFQRSH